MNMDARLSRMQRQLVELSLIRQRLQVQIDRANLRIDGSVNDLQNDADTYESNARKQIEENRLKAIAIASQASQQIAANNSDRDRLLTQMEVWHHLGVSAIHAHGSVRKAAPVYESDFIEGGPESWI